MRGNGCQLINLQCVDFIFTFPNVESLEKRNGVEKSPRGKSIKIQGCTICSQIVPYCRKIALSVRW